MIAYADLHPNNLLRAKINLDSSYLLVAAGAFSDSFNNKNPGLTEIIVEVARQFDMDVAKTYTRSRRHPYIFIRQMAYLLARELTPHSLKEIGTMFNHNVDHSTVINGINSIRNQIETDANFHTIYTNCINNLKPYR